MWAIYDNCADPIVCGNRSLMQICQQRTGCNAIRAAVIPLDDVEAIVERADQAYWAEYGQSMAGDLTQIRSALTAAGIPCKRKASK